MPQNNGNNEKQVPSNPSNFEKSGREVKPARYEGPSAPPKQPEKKE